ncbi:S-adenosyl-L-methionine-dependent methyltransferase [Coemansia reversa NRRL 1564]|uniref:S-adenosyl-L-methionine-dependent methyltransferase n=1 Tax=Coemansia reversa (strain ATCC 12441 / NRRL 1564) TaxID=763665 RepID=A0A2G5B2C3_COERN|nr:S-adenosyl-L-methionine-dependent methyltransferase [Coemansia reversa NRRL 1564]|eukprot:PIA13141.1 S-adenosyl-L-methionine-dependent methyltransferase [Coemansia reversa NRRL 1564]
MISPLQGAFMASLVRAQQAKVVLELGCYIGYSALWLAHGFRCNGVNTGAHLWTCERDTDAAYTAQKNIQMAGYQDTVTVMQQSADLVLSKWDPKKKIDLVFIDANKSAYKSYYDAIIDRELLQDGGQIIVDNVLFRGMVSKQSDLVDNINAKMSVNSEDQRHNKLTQLAQKLGKFNRHVAKDPRTTQVILPIFDGIMIIQRAQILK